MDARASLALGGVDLAAGARFLRSPLVVEKSSAQPINAGRGYLCLLIVSLSAGAGWARVGALRGRLAGMSGDVEGISDWRPVDWGDAGA